MAKTKSTKKSQKEEAVIYFEDEASANANICPSIKRLFDEIITGRPLCYTPIQIVQEFELYIADIRANPVQVVTKYDQVVTTKWLARAPKVSDFVNRWLGKDMSWWSRLSDTSNNKQAKEYEAIKSKIQGFCYDIKLSGAMVGIFNHNIIARELGLTDKQQINSKTQQVIIQVNNEEEAKRMQELADME